MGERLSRFAVPVSCVGRCGFYPECDKVFPCERFCGLNLVDCDIAEQMIAWEHHCGSVLVLFFDLLYRSCDRRQRILSFRLREDVVVRD